jgi:outer membrane protein assembly factor BamB
MPLFTYRVVGSPIIASQLIFAAAGTGGVGRQMFAIRPGDPERGLEPQVAYEIKGPIPYVVTPVAKDPLLFLWNDQGIVTCLDAPTGKIRWRERLGGDFFASPVRVDDRLYCISRKGEMVVLAAAEQYRLLARFDLGERSQSTPAVAGGMMFLRTHTRLMAIGGK